jgi:hypothetical protein
VISAHAAGRDGASDARRAIVVAAMVRAVPSLVPDGQARRDARTPRRSRYAGSPRIAD